MSERIKIGLNIYTVNSFGRANLYAPDFYYQEPEEDMDNVWFGAPLKSENFDEKEHDLFKHWFKDNCKGCYRWPSPGKLLFSIDEDRVLYFLFYF